jgi:hypothetical protein
MHGCLTPSPRERSSHDGQMLRDIRHRKARKELITCHPLSRLAQLSTCAGIKSASKPISWTINTHRSLQTKHPTHQYGATTSAPNRADHAHPTSPARRTSRVQQELCPVLELGWPGDESHHSHCGWSSDRPTAVSTVVGYASTGCPRHLLLHSSLLFVLHFPRIHCTGSSVSSSRAE